VGQSYQEAHPFEPFPNLPSTQPFKNHAQCSAWHFSFDYTIFDVHYNLVVTIPRMKMGRLVIREVHPNVYSVEKTNLWHIYFLFLVNDLVLMIRPQI
jgi:hypothetical protein